VSAIDARIPEELDDHPLEDGVHALDLRLRQVTPARIAHDLRSAGRATA
jgi:hypothetical protein